MKIDCAKEDIMLVADVNRKLTADKTEDIEMPGHDVHIPKKNRKVRQF